MTRIKILTTGQTGASRAASATSVTRVGNIGATDVQAALEELDAEKQPLDADLTAIAALSTQSFGRSLLTQASASAARTTLGVDYTTIAADTALTSRYGAGITQSAEGVVVEPWAITWATAGAAKFSVQAQSFDNTGAGAGTKNHGIWWGMNAGRHGSGSVTANAPAALFGVEDNYYDDGGDNFRGMEMYWEFWSPDGTSQTGVRPFYARWRSDSNTPRGIQILSCVGPSGGIGQFTIRSGTHYTGDTNLFSVTPTAITLNKPTTQIDAGGPFQVRTTSGQAQLLLNAGSVAAALLFQVASSSSFNLSATSVNTLGIYNKDFNLHATFTYGATASAAITDFASSVKVQAGFSVFNAALVTTKPTVTGAKGGNAAVASILAALVSYGLITDSTTA